MRIERQTNLQIDIINKGTIENKKVDSFQSMMKTSQSKMHLESLNQLMNRIDIQGERLAKQRTIENLRDYKSWIRQFIRESLTYGQQLSEKQSDSPNGSRRTYHLVEIIDQKLLQIQDEVLESEKEGINLLQLIGEVKGILINLYM